MGLLAVWEKFYKTLASIRTGVILLILVVIFSAVGTFVLQRPTAEAGQIERAYSPETLRILDAVGLTDIFHAWYFLTLLALVSLSIIFVSIDRWPNAWRFYARPYRRPESHFRAVLPHHTEIPIKDAKVALEAAERGFRSVGLPAERVVDHDEVSLYSEKNRFAVMAVFIIHSSLLLIFMGGIIDGLFGYRGFMAIDEGTSNNVIEQRIGGKDVQRQLSFSVRCDAAGQENYKQNGRDTGMPKQYWSKLTIIDNGKAVKSKEIVVNDPLVYRGIRMFQSSMGKTGKLSSADIMVADASGKNEQKITLKPDTAVQIAPDTTVQMGRFVPDFYIQDNEVFTKSEQPNNPALQLIVKKAGKEYPAWIFFSMGTTAQEANTGYMFAITDAKQANFTGLQVSFEPGHYFVWAGCVVMLFGLIVAFYMVHMRFWAIAVHDERKGLVLWIGGAFNKNKERFEERYKKLIEAVEKELRIRENGSQLGPQSEQKQSARETTSVSV